MYSDHRNYPRLNSIAKILKASIPREDDALITLGRGWVWSVFDIVAVDVTYRLLPKIPGGIRITVNYKKLNSIRKNPKISTTRVDEVLHTLGDAWVCSVVDLFWGFSKINHGPPRC